MKLLPLLLLISCPAWGQTLCGHRDEIVAQLGSGYDEAVIASGVSSPGGIIELLVSPTGTFTIIHSTPLGVSCLIAAGEGWERSEWKKTPKSQTTAR